jgi:purine-binding chemotaxis protein CheW
MGVFVEPRGPSVDYDASAVTNMSQSLACVEAILDTLRIALPLHLVDRVLRAVDVHPAPAGGGCLLGAVDVAGELVPVYELRKLLGLPPRGLPLRLDDRIVLVRAPLRCGLVVDAVAGTVDAQGLALGGEFSLQAGGVRGVARGPEGVLLVQDLRRLLALERAIPIVAHG